MTQRRHRASTGNCIRGEFRMLVPTDKLSAQDYSRNLTRFEMATADKTAFAIGKGTLSACSMLALTLIGIADAIYVAHGNYSGEPLWCPILEGCNTVINSPYSRVFGTP